MPMVVAMSVPMVVTPMLTTNVQTMLAAMVQTVIQSMVPNMDTMSRDHRMSLGASLRDRATLSSPLRGLAPSGGYPSRLRSLRSLRAPLARRLASLTAACRTDAAGAAFDGIGVTTAAFSSRRRFAPRLSQTSPRSPWPAAPAAGIASGSVRCAPCVAGCRLRRAPARAPPGAVLAALVRALLRSTPALRSAPRRAVVPAPVRALPPPPPAACYARLPAAPAAPPATQSPWRLPSAGFAGVDSPIAHTADSAVLTARGGLWFHTRRIPDAARARVHLRPLRCPWA